MQILLKIICVYRPRGPLCPHLIVFMNHLAPEKNFQMTDIEMVSMWQDAFKKGAIKNMAAFERIYNFGKDASFTSNKLPKAF